MTSPRFARKRRVVLLNDYPMRTALARVEAGEYPAQHLWGYLELRERYDWVLPRWGHSAVAKALPRTEPLLWKTIAVIGDVLQQPVALRHAAFRRDTIVYGADLQSSALIGVFKRLHLLRCAYVVVVHNGPRNGWSRFWMNGADYIVTLDHTTAEQVRSVMRRPVESVRVLPWGPSLDSAAYLALSPVSALQWDFVCAGRSNRAYDAVRAAARTGRINGLIFTGSTVETFRDGVVEERPHSGGYVEVLEAIHSARCSLIPLEDPNRLSGLTEAADAIALNVPVLVSVSPKYPYFTEACTPGTIDERDPESLIAAIEALPRERSGSRPTVLEEAFNMREYSRQLSEIFDSL